MAPLSNISSDVFDDDDDDAFDLGFSRSNGTSSSSPQLDQVLPFGLSSSSTRLGSGSGSASGSALARFNSNTTSVDDGLPLPVTTSTTTTDTFSPRTTKRFVASAKGKAKAVKDDEAVGHPLVHGHDYGEGGATSSSVPTGMAFSIRFTDGSEDLMDLWAGEKESVAEVKRRIRFLRPNLMHEDRPRRLRLIQLGRLLTDGIYLVPWTAQLLSRRAKLVRQQTQPNSEALLEGAIEGIEAAVRVTVPRASIDLKGRTKQDAAHQRKDSKGKGKEKDRTLAGTEAEDDKRVWLHCSVGEPMDDEEIDSERVQTTQITPLQGFDRLRDAGFSEEEIATMRAEFRRNNSAGGDDDEHARALEDQWMEGLTGQNEAAATESTTEGYWMKMLGGLCVGFFFPFLPFFFFRTHLFSRTTQMAIVLGVVINAGFGIMRLFT